MILNDLAEKELDALEQTGALKRYSKGEFVIREGMIGSSFAIIVSGRVRVQKSVAGAKHKKLAELGPCDVVGEIGFLGGESRSASVVAVTDCEVLEFQREKLEEYLRQHSELGVKIYRGLARELARRLARSDESLLDAIAWAMGNGESEDSEPRTADIPIPRRVAEGKSPGPAAAGP